MGITTEFYDRKIVGMPAWTTSRRTKNTGWGLCLRWKAIAGYLRKKVHGSRNKKLDIPDEGMLVWLREPA